MFFYYVRMNQSCLTWLDSHLNYSDAESVETLQRAEAATLQPEKTTNQTNATGQGSTNCRPAGLDVKYWVTENK